MFPQHEVDPSLPAPPITKETDTNLLQAESEDVLTTPDHVHPAAGVRHRGGVHHGGPVLVPQHPAAAQLELFSF